MSLRITYDEIERKVARRLGYPLARTVRSEDEQLSVDDAICTGLRWFYFPTGDQSHEWSFVRRYNTIDLVVGQNWYELPADFQRLASVAIVSYGNHPLSNTTEEGIRLRITGEGLSGTPEYSAVRNKQVTHDTRYEIGVYPTPDREGTLSFWYMFAPETISQQNPYPLGGETHGDTIIASVLAAAEAQQNPELLGTEGSVHYQLFQQKLTNSIVTDMKQLGMV